MLLGLACTLLLAGCRKELSASLLSPVALDEVTPQTEFTIEFTEAMDPESAPQPLKWVPPIAVQYRWDESGTRLTFAAQRSFTPGRAYTFFLSPDLHTAQGEAFEKPLGWSIAVPTPPVVVGRESQPLGAVGRRFRYEVAFNVPMDPESVGAALTVRPEVELATEWFGSTLRVETADLEPGVEYRFFIDATALSAEGSPLHAPYSWTEDMPRLVRSVRTPDYRSADVPVVVQFGYPIDFSALRPSLRLTPRVAGDFVYDPESHRLTFRPDAPLPLDTQFVLSSVGAVRDQAGGTLGDLAPIRFHTPAAVTSVSPQPGAATPLTASVVIEFARSMDRASVESAFRLEPAVEGAFSWFGSTLTFRPTSGYLEPETTYVVALDAGVRDETGAVVLEEPWTRSFVTLERQPLASFGYEVEVLVGEPAQPITFPYNVETGGITTLTFEVYRLPGPEFARRYLRRYYSSQTAEAAVRWDDLPLTAAWEASTGPCPYDYGCGAEAELPGLASGYYLVNLVTDELEDQRFLIVTGEFVTVKSYGGQVLAWVTTRDGRPVADADIEVYTADGRLAAEGDTDDDGLFESWVFGDSPPVMILSQAGLDVSGVGIEWGWDARSYGCGYWRGDPHETIRDDSQETLAHIHTDRPIYRPGDLVHFKAVLRRDQDGLLDIPDTEIPVTVRLRDGRDNLLATTDLLLSRFGTVAGEFELTDGAMLGPHTIQVTIAGDSAAQEFKVEDYRKPDIDVTVQPTADRYMGRDEIEVVVEAEYLFGQPVVGAEVSVRLFEMFEGWWGESYDPVGAPRKVTTDSAGQATLSLRAPEPPSWWAWRTSLSTMTLGIEATVDDGSHQVVSGLATRPVYSAAEVVSLRTGGYYHGRLRPVPITAEVRTLDDEPVEGRSVTFTLTRWLPDTWDQETVHEAEVVTDDGGLASLVYVPDRTGWYEVHARGLDEQGHAMETARWFYAAGSEPSGRRSVLRISVDRDSYAPGDVARLMIETDFAGPALLTMERASVRRHELIQLTPPLTILEVPIRTDDVPNIFATVSAWAPPIAEAYGLESLGALATRSVEITVPAVDRRLEVTVTPDRETYAPGDTATFHIEVTGAGGSPVDAELSLALVDEAIFRLSEDLSPAIFDTFHGPREHRVSTFDTFSIARYLGGGDGCGGGGGDVAPVSPRSDFPDTALWMPRVETGEDGVVDVRVTMPDTLTTWRLTARAVTVDSRVGETRRTVVTTQPLVVRPILPRALTVGDLAIIGAAVHNGSDEAQTVAASLTADGLALRAEATQRFRLDPGQARFLTWPVLADEVGEARLVFRVEGATMEDAVELPLMIQPLGAREVFVQAGDFDGTVTMTVFRPADALPEGGLRIEISRDVAAGLLDGLEYLTSFPYGCVEQTMSAVLPNAVIARAFRELGVVRPGFEESITPKIASGLAGLYALQHDDGGWGWWWDDSSDAYQTAWVVLGLGLTRQAGYEVDPTVIERGAEWLVENLPAIDLRTRAFALYSLAAVERDEPEWAAELLAHAEGLDPFSQAALALALDAGGDEAGALQVAEVLADSAEQDAGYVRWSIPWEDGEYNRKTMASDVRATALALSAFEQLGGIHPELRGGMARWLMAQRKSYGWGTTNETAFTILGLTDYLRAVTAEGGTSSVRVTLNGEQIASGELDRDQPSLSLEVAIEDLRPGENTLELAEDGSGRLFYHVRAESVVPRASLPQDGRLRVSRVYADPVTKRPLDRIEAGQLVLVQVDVDLPDDQSFMIIEDHPPAGLEPLNEGLNTTSFSARPEDVYYYDVADWFFWEEYGYNYKEIHPGRVSFFVSSLGEGPHTFSYYARATHVGTYVAQPAEAWAMYDLDAWGRSASLSLEVWEAE
jgi:uncharacterized protein YfaS (alpha-2-macroglobulin family)